MADNQDPWASVATPAPQEDPWAGVASPTASEPSTQNEMGANATVSQSTNPLAALTGYAANMELPGMKQVGSALAATAGYGQDKTQGSGVMPALERLGERYSNLNQAQEAMQKTGKELYPSQTALGNVSENVALNAPLIGAVPKVAKWLGSSEGLSALGEAAAGELPQGAKAPVPELDPVDIIRSHGASQQAASNVNGVIGDGLRTMAGDAVGYAPNAKSSVEDLLDQAQNGTEPMKNRAQVVKQLQHTLSQFDENGNMPIQSALDLRVLANQNYKSGQNLYTGAWGDVKDAADSVLADHAVDNPEFGQMLHLQRVHNANDVGEAYKNNDTLQKMFGVDDLKNVSDADSGILRNVGTDTQKAANSIVSKIKTPEDYEAVARGIDDPQVLRQFNDSVLQNILPSRGQYLWNTLKNAGNFHFADALENFGKTFVPKLGMSEENQGILSAIKENATTPTRYSVGQTEAKANDILSNWQNRIANTPPDTPPTSRIALPPPNVNVPRGGFYQGEVQEPPINYNGGQKALPAPRDMTYEDMVNSGRILPSPENMPVRVPRGGFTPKSAEDITSDFQSQLNKDYPSAVEQYNQIPETQGGKVLNTDIARELSPDYLADRTQSAAVHEPASNFIKRTYAQKLKEAPAEGEEPTVLFTAGGTGSGKTTAINDVLKNGVNKSQMIYDTNMNNFANSKDKIDQALNAGKGVNIAYVYRDPVEAFQNGVLPRAVRQEQEFGSGRTVPLQNHINTHVGSLSAIKDIAEHYADDPRVNMTAIDNSFGKGQAKEIPIDSFPKISQTGLKQKLMEVLDDQYKQGKISKSIYQGISGKEP